MANGLHPPRVSAAAQSNARWVTVSVRKMADSYGLTSRESEIVEAVILGLSNKEIGDRCGIAEQTVKDHLKHVFLKVGVHQRTALLARVLSHSTGGQETG